MKPTIVSIMPADIGWVIIDVVNDRISEPFDTSAAAYKCIADSNKGGMNYIVRNP